MCDIGGGSQPQPAQQTENRNYGQETRDTLQAQIDLAPAKLAADQATQPAYAQLNADILKQTAPQIVDLYSGLYPQLSALQNESNTTQRASDIADVQNLGRTATDAFRSANPQATAAIDRLNASAASAGPSEIEQELNRQALEQLKAGGMLTPEEQRAADQQIASYYASRGLSYSRPAIAARILNRQSVQDAKLQQRQQFAGAVDAATQGRIGADRAFQGNVANLNFATATDPFLAILGRPSNTAATAANAFTNTAATATGGGSMFNPESAYAQDLYNTNYNSKAATNIANANMRASAYGANQAAQGALWGGLFSGLGAVGGAAMMAA